MVKKRNYEIAFILKEGDVGKASLERIKGYLNKVKGTQTGEHDMGIRQLAYTIFKNREKFNKAFYYFLKAEMEPSHVVDFERLIKLDEDIIRHMVIVED